MKQSKVFLAGLLLVGYTLAAPPVLAQQVVQSAASPRVEQELRCRANSDGTWYCEYVIKW